MKKTVESPKRRIGIYAGTFDPVHTGHIAFALQALQIAHLDEIYFLPERRPRHKQGVEHFAHRTAMILRALKPYPQFKVLEQPDISFSVGQTLPRLQKQFNGAQLVFLFGSDVIANIMDWPKVERLLVESELVIGLRAKDDEAKIKAQIINWRVQPSNLTIFASYAPYVSSGQVREALRKRENVHGLLSSVQKYSDHNWLYVSFS